MTLLARDGLVVGGGTGVPMMSYDAATGAPCATVIDGAPTSIDPYTQRASIAHGMLVGGAGRAVHAVDLRSGRTRWTHEVASGSNDEYALRDQLDVVATASAVVIGFRVSYGSGDAVHHEELVAALDPATGAERWRVVTLAHPRGPISFRSSILLASDADRVYILAPGTLTAVDGATGAQLWRATWAAAPPAVGPPRPGPLIASDGSSVALSVPGRIRLFDARNGSPRGDVAVTGEIGELVARAGSVYAAIEAAPGSASVIAIDAAAPRVRWTYPASYAVQRLRADDDLVYVLDGNGRVWGLDPATARPRFAVNASTFDFVVTRSPTGAPRIVVPGTSLTAYDPHALPPPLAPFLRWEIAVSGDRCRLHALAWVDGNDRIVWQRPLPARWQPSTSGPCDDIASYMRTPRTARPSAVLGLHDTGATVIEADHTGVLALRKADGAIALDAATTDEDRPLFFDDGTFTLTGLPGCSGPADRARVFAVCGKRLVYFNGVTAMIIALDPLRIEARGTYDIQAPGQSLGHAQHRTSIAVGRYTLTLEGIIYEH